MAPGHLPDTAIMPSERLLMMLKEFQLHLLKFGEAVESRPSYLLTIIIE